MPLYMDNGDYSGFNFDNIDGALNAQFHQQIAQFVGAPSTGALPPQNDIPQDTTAPSDFDSIDARARASSGYGTPQDQAAGSSGIPPSSPPANAPAATPPASPYNASGAYGPDAQSSTPVATGGQDDLHAYARQAAARAGIDPEQFVRQIQQESSFDPTARNPSGATGIAQIVPQAHPGVDPTDPRASLDYAANLMATYGRQYGGDQQKALAAYNAGPGNVEKYGGVPPFEETKNYIANILGGAGQAVGGAVSAAANAVQGIGKTANQQSQFGDPTLSADEAYAACGPAAAVRFAQAYGRNPTLREATDLAKQVGWTQDQGMAGIGSEQALLQKMGVPTKVVGPDWQAIAKEAQTGNPVTISTPGHYFYADGYDPQSGAFHVGASGTDLRGGSEWMTPEQMQARMGAVQGALFADHPNVAASSTAGAQGGASAENAAGQAFGGSPQDTAQPQSFEAIDAKAAQGYHQSLADFLMQGIGNGASTAVKTLTGSTPEELGQGVSDLGTAAHAVADQVPQAASTALQTQTGSTPEQVNQSLADVTQFQQEHGLMSPLMTTDPDVMANITDKLLHDQPLTPDEQNTLDHYSFAVAGATSPMNVEGGWKAALQPDPILKALGPAPEKAATAPTYGGSLGEQVTRQLFSGDQPLRSFEDDVARITGKPLAAEQRPSEIARLATDPAAKVMVDQGLKPAIQAAGPDLEAVQALLKARNNVNVADVLRVRAASEQASQLAQQARDAARTTAPVPREFREGSLARVASQSADVGLRVEAPAYESLDPRELAATARQAARQTNAVAANRQFSGGITADQSKQAIDTLAQQLGPERFARVNQAADDIFAYTGQLRQQLVDSGVWSKDFADQLGRQYPDWVPTRILDYMDDNGAGGMGVGKKIGLADDGLRRYTEEGTARFRQDPIQSAIDLTGQTLARARQNEAFLAFKALNDAMPAERQIMRAVGASEKLPPEEMAINGFVDGQKARYAVPKAIGNVITGAGSANLPSWSGTYARFFRDATTGRNPVFLAGNAALDAPDYTLYMTSKYGIQHLPEILTELAKSYVGTFDGLLQNELRGTSAKLMLAGGGQSGAAMRSQATSETVANLARPNIFTVNGLSDIKRLAAAAAKFEWASSVGERVELAPRRAAFNLAQKYGESPTRAALTGRDVTIDFGRGGEATKFVNNFVPYFNVPFQAAAQPVRMFRNNPQGFAMGMTGLIGLPTVAAEAWNLADPQRAADYADVSDYYKNNGIVVMTDSGTPDPRTGERSPNFIWINLRQFAPFATIAREGAHRVLTGQFATQGWGDLLNSLTNPIAPVDLTNPANSLTRMGGSVPGLGTAAQLGMNKNTFTGAAIASRRADENAGGTARALSGVANAGLTAIGSTARVRPSQVQFGLPSVGGGLGAVALGAGDLALGGKPSGGIREAPVVGGVTGRFYRTGGGQLLRDAQSQTVAPDVLKGLEQAGVQYRPGTVQDTLKGLPLTQPEQARFQARANQLTNDALRQALPTINRLPPAQREMAAQTVGEQARARAEQELYGSLPPSAATRPRNGAPVPAPVTPGRAPGEPQKYIGVSNYGRQMQIDEARSAVAAWESSPGRAPRPTSAQMALAGQYGETNPAWTAWNQRNAATRLSTRAAVEAPIPR